MTTAADLLRELSTFISIPGSLIEKAELSGINSDNSEDFYYIVEDWADGVYDEDPGYAVNEIENLL